MSTEPLSEAQALRALAGRLMTQPHPEGPVTAELFVGALPDGLDLDIPRPSGATLLGSRLKRLSGRPASVDAVFDGEGQPRAIVDAYTAALQADGWTLLDGIGPRLRGFFSGADRADASLWRDGRGPVLRVAVAEREGAPTDVRLHLDWETAARHPHQPRSTPPGEDLLPPLRAPSGVVVRGQSGGGSERHWEMETTVQTDRSVVELEQHFAAQLVDAGWHRIAGPTDELIARSSWDLPRAEGWRGVLTIRSAGKGERQLTVRVQRSDGAD